MNSIDKLAISFISNGLKYSVSKAEEVYKKIKPKKNKTFREKMEVKLATQLILMNNIIKNERTYQLNKNSMHS